MSILAGGYLALGQSDIKKLIAYSSVGHMGFVTLGVFLLNSQGINGAMLQMINHGITTGALFICVGIIYERTHSREISANSALGMFMPIYVTFLGIFSLSSLAFQERILLWVSFWFFWLRLVNTLWSEVLPLSELCLLRPICSDFRKWFGLIQTGMPTMATMKDITVMKRKNIIFLTLVSEKLRCSCFDIFVFWIGLNPSPILKIMNASVDNLVTQAGADKVVGVTAAIK